MKKEVSEFKILKGFWIFCLVYFALFALLCFYRIDKTMEIRYPAHGLIFWFLLLSYGYKDIKKVYDRMKDRAELKAAFRKLHPLGLLWGRVEYYSRVMLKYNVTDPELLRLAQIIDIKGKAAPYFFLLTLVSFAIAKFIFKLPF